MPHHIEGGENVGSQPGHVMPDKVEGHVWEVIEVFW